MPHLHAVVQVLALLAAACQAMMGPLGAVLLAGLLKLHFSGRPAGTVVGRSFELVDLKVCSKTNFSVPLPMSVGCVSPLRLQNRRPSMKNHLCLHNAALEGALTTSRVVGIPPQNQVEP